MNVYDFDGTVYRGDSTVDFYFYCLKKHPRILKYAVRQFRWTVKHALGKCDTGKMKGGFLCFLSALDGEALAEAFWDKNSGKIERFYLDRRRDDDIFISASPEFLLAPICRRLGISPPIATRVDVSSGKLIGENCKGNEKVKRFRQLYPDAVIDRFYTDSMTDLPLAGLAEKAFLVKKGALSVLSEEDGDHE